MAQYRKTKKGDWVVFGPTSEVKPGRVTVTKKNGSTKTEVVDTVGKSFDVNGVPHCYGYIQEKPQRSYSRYGGSSRCHTDGNCSSMCNPNSCPCGTGGWFRCC